jgi:hypothetical protein
MVTQRERVASSTDSGRVQKVEIMRRIVLACALAGILGVPVCGQQAVNPEGIYQLNFAKSTIRGPTSKSADLNYTPDGFTGTGCDADGKPGTSTVTVIADGKPHPGDRCPL